MRISGITYVPRKTHKARNIFTVILLLFLVSILAVIAVSGYAGWKLIHPERVGIEPFSSNIVPEYRDVNFNAKDENVTLNGWFFEVKGSSKTVILAHGYGKNRLQFEGETLDIIKGFISRGYNVLSFDFRNSGKSGGKLTSMGLYEKNDLLGAISYVKSQGSGNIVLMGFSTGASTSILAAAEAREVDAVIADTPYAELKKYLFDNVEIWSNLPEIPFNRTVTYAMQILGGMDIDKASPRRAIISISPRAVFLIHSKDDEIIPIENSQTLHSIYSKSSSSNYEFWQTEEVGHLESYTSFPKEYMSRIFKFLDKVYEKK